MTPTRINTLLHTITIAAALGALAGCPFQTQPHSGTDNMDAPPTTAFAIPDQATAARIRDAQAVVYAVADNESFEYDFYFAEPDEPREDHLLISSISATELGFEEGDTLVLPKTISFADDLDRAVIGFEDESYLLTASANPQAQIFGSFTATPLTALDGPALNPTINPSGTQVAFETTTGDIATGPINEDALTPGQAGTGDVVSDVTVLGRGINPIFGFDDTVGFSSPDFAEFAVTDFTTNTRTTFTVSDATVVGVGFDPPPFTTFEAGYTPGAIGTVGTVTATAPLTFGPGQFGDGL